MGDLDDYYYSMGTVQVSANGGGVHEKLPPKEQLKSSPTNVSHKDRDYHVGIFGRVIFFLFLSLKTEHSERDRKTGFLEAAP